MIDNKLEILDVVDANGTVISQAIRWECHQDPSLIHRVAHCWIFNSSGQVLWQLRSPGKDSSPGLWDMSCGGHVAHGETPESTLSRELREELGLTRVKYKFVEKYLRTSADARQTELIYLYYAVVDKPADKFVIPEAEVEQVRWIDVAEAQMLYLGGQVPATDFIVTQVSRILQYIFMSAHKS